MIRVYTLEQAEQWDAVVRSFREHDIYWLSGYYNEVFRKSRMQELFTTVWSVTIITICIFLIALINDVNIVQHHQRGLDYEVIAWLWGLQFVLVYAYRVVVTTDTSTKII